MTASLDETSTIDVTASTADSHPAAVREAAEVTDLEKVRGDRLTAAAQRREAARTRDLTALLRERPDLDGVHAPADFAVDSLRWCV
jgi:hypothetical protein